MLNVYLRDQEGNFIPQPHWEDSKALICPDAANDWYYVYGKIILQSDTKCTIEVRDDLLALIRNFFLKGAESILKDEDYYYEAFSYEGIIKIASHRNAHVSIVDLSGTECSFSKKEIVSLFLKAAKNCLDFMDSIKVKEDEDMKDVLNRHIRLYEKMMALSLKEKT